MSWAARKQRVLRAVTRTFSDGPFTYTPADGSPPYTLEHVPFDEPHVALNLGNEVEVSSVEPSAFVRLSDLLAPPAERDKLEHVASARTFEVIEVQADGQGGATLILQETTPGG